MGPTQKGQLQFQFSGEGGSFFGVLFVNMLLTFVTLYIYLPWAVCKIVSWWLDHTVAVAPDGSQYKLRFTGDGGSLFGTWFVGALLSVRLFDQRGLFFSRWRTYENSR